MAPPAAAVQRVNRLNLTNKPYSHALPGLVIFNVWLDLHHYPDRKHVFVWLNPIQKIRAGAAFDLNSGIAEVRTAFEQGRYRSIAIDISNEKIFPAARPTIRSLDVRNKLPRLLLHLSDPTLHKLSN